MKRDQLPDYPLARIYPLFTWHLCASCRLEFRREWGWRYVSCPWSEAKGRLQFLCATCAPSRRDALTLAGRCCRQHDSGSGSSVPLSLIKTP